MKLRNYQHEFCAAVETEWKENRSTLGVMFTGLGKTICFAEIIKRYHPKRALVIAHREELIFQARDKILEHAGLHMEVEMGDYRASTESALFSKTSGIVSSIQTLTAGGDGAGRMSKFDPNDFDLLITDEAHHSTALTYRRVTDYFMQNPRLKHLGVTATPDRVDKAALGQVFESVAFEYEADDATADGWLVPVDQQFATIGELDYSGIRTTAGDLNGADLAKVMEAEKPLYAVADEIIKLIGNRRTIAFCASVAHAEMLCSILQRYQGIVAAWICGKTDKDTRRRILSDFAAGKIQVVCNCGVLTEGYDDCGVEVIAMARPTKSRALYAQMLGRGLRPLPGIVDGPSTVMGRRFAISKSRKPECTVLDFVGNSGKHKLITSLDVLGGKYSDEAIEAAIIQAKKTGKPMKVKELLEDEEERIKKEKAERELAEAARKANLIVPADVAWKKVDPYDILQVAPVVKERAWDDGKVLKEKWSEQLRNQGFDPAAQSYGQSMAILRSLWDRSNKGLCTFRMAKQLRKLGCNPDMPFDEAKIIISAAAANGWRKPAVMPTVNEPAMATEGNENEPF